MIKTSSCESECNECLPAAGRVAFVLKFLISLLLDNYKILNE